MIPDSSSGWCAHYIAAEHCRDGFIILSLTFTTGRYWDGHAVMKTVKK